MKRTLTTILVLIFFAAAIGAALLMLPLTQKTVASKENITTEEEPIHGWIYTNEGTMYLSTAGDAAKGITEIDGVEYYFNDDGYIDSGWKTDKDGKKYYVNPNGTIASGWVNIHNYTYYLNEDGTPHPGWTERHGMRYYIKDNGSVTTGITQIKGTYYTFNDKGQLITKNSLLDTIGDSPEETVKNDDTLIGIGGYTPTSEDKAGISSVMDEINSKGGYNIGFVMINLYSGEGVAYNMDNTVYSASCIKGPYIASLVNSKPEILEKNSRSLQLIVEESDNKLYSSSRRTYGREFFADWCEEAGVSTDVATYNYPHLSARILAKLWVQNYYFFNTDELGMEIRDWYTSPNQSAIYYSLGRISEDEDLKSVVGDDKKGLGYRTESKAGWISDKARATTDGGIIYPTGKAPYIIAICTDLPSDMASLEPLCIELNNIYENTISSP